MSGEVLLKLHLVLKDGTAEGQHTLGMLSAECSLHLSSHDMLNLLDGSTSLCRVLVCILRIIGSSLRKEFRYF